MTELTLRDAPAPKSRKGDPCTIKDCTKPILGRDWCAMHYARWQKYGDALHEVRRYIAQGEGAGMTDAHGSPSGSACAKSTLSA